jgi:hypothetical protein
VEISNGRAKDGAERRKPLDAFIASARLRFHALQVIGVLTQDQASSITRLLECDEKTLSAHDLMFRENIIRYLKKEANFVSVFAEMLQIDLETEHPGGKSQSGKSAGKSKSPKSKRAPPVAAATPWRRTAKTFLLSLPPIRTYVLLALIAAGAVLLAAYAAFPPGGASPSHKAKATRIVLDADAGALPVPAAAIFPSSIAQVHADEGPYEAALNTCYDQFKANRETNANGGLKWSQNGVGYYSECLKRLNP